MKYITDSTTSIAVVAVASNMNRYQSSSSLALKALEEQVNCLICHEECINPKVLPCHHSFCLQCIEKLPTTINKVSQITVTMRMDIINTVYSL